MSGLAHFLEDEGLSTTLVALVREHVEKVQPPRALWVPFMLGRPFGEPNNSELQRNVIRQSFRLLDEQSGPILKDADLPEFKLEETEGWACPVSFSQEKAGDSVGDQITKEIVELRPWYNLHFENGNRTTVGLSNSSIEECAEGLVNFHAEPNQIANEIVEVVNNLRWWSSDLKAFYMEAVIAQPGKVSAADLESWFWDDTSAGFLFREIREQCVSHPSLEVREIGKYMIGELESEYYVRQYSGLDL